MRPQVLAKNLPICGLKNKMHEISFAKEITFSYLYFQSKQRP